LLEAAYTQHTSQVSGASRPVITSVLDGVRPDILKGAIQDGVAGWDAVSVAPMLLCHFGGSAGASRIVL
jgi:hypothetical protein